MIKVILLVMASLSNILLYFLHIIKISPTFQAYVRRTLLNAKIAETGNSFNKRVELGGKGRHLSGPDKIRQLCSILKGAMRLSFPGEITSSV